MAENYDLVETRIVLRLALMRDTILKHEDILWIYNRIG